MRKNVLLFTAVFLSSSALTFADVRLPALFSDNMVLQRGRSVPVWGWADDGEKVTVTFRDQKVSTKAKNGKWHLKLSSLKAGGPDVFKVTGKNSIELTNVLVGEVWVAGGQSNMEFPLSRSYEVDADIAASRNSMLRFFQVPNVKSDKPLDDVQASWKESSPETSPSFSAVAYYFGRDIQKTLNVPVGLIESDWGGTPAEAWMSHEALEENPRYRKEILDKYDAAQKSYLEALHKLEQAKAANPGKKFKTPRAPWKPSELYNAMIAPLIPYAIEGAIWYQGENNAPRAELYRSVFPDMIRNWRDDWDQGKFPFLLVQLAPFKPIQPQPAESDWAELRDAQLNATKVLPKVGMAVITDVGMEHNIHPTKKGPVGARLAVAARKIAYGEDVVYSGPIFKKMKVKDGKAILSFDHVGSGLVARGGDDLKGFAICGPDKKFVWANAEIDGDKVIVSSPNVEKPIAVRYGWADYPVVNLWNKDGLPASPFRTDDFPMITAGKY